MCRNEWYFFGFLTIIAVVNETECNNIRNGVIRRVKMARDRL